MHTYMMYMYSTYNITYNLSNDNIWPNTLDVLDINMSMLESPFVCQKGIIEAFQSIRQWTSTS